uniref:uncharacterized protein LOC122583501 n=1 Tax=Erigeron canadensis TaxID=72917 RepID=UPI001CB92C02|nr:uncharacterized protein LOC122583501 [Erigeron canadensis]
MARNIYVPFFDGSRVNPIKEASIIVLDNASCLDISDEGIVSWLVPLLENESTVVSTSTICFSESCDAHSPKFSIFHSNIKSCFSTSNDCSLSFSSSSIEGDLEVIDLEECSMDKPLFWPPSLIPEWGLVTEWDLFAMSPRKNICIVEKSTNTPPNSPSPILLNPKMNLQKAKRTLVFGLGSNSSANLEIKTENGKKVIRRMKSMPSRFKKGAKALEDDNFTKKCGQEKVSLEDLLVLDEKLNVAPAIEILLGLEEFDGHEGVESEFNKDDFSLDVII